LILRADKHFSNGFIKREKKMWNIPGTVLNNTFTISMRTVSRACSFNLIRYTIFTKVPWGEDR
jgi:hypothetical protein